MNYSFAFAFLAVSLSSSTFIHSMTSEELNENYPWKVDALCYVKKPDGSVVIESIYKDEEAAIPQPCEDGVPDSLKQHIVATMPQVIENKFRYLQHHPRYKSFLITGPTGSGKTSLASAIAHKLNQPCSFYDSQDLIGPWRNTASVNIQKILNPIVNQKDVPQTVVIDNLEYIIKRHNDGGDNGALVFGSYLTQLEHSHHPITIIGIANNNIDIPWQISARVTDKIHLDLPDTKQREEAFAYHMQQEKGSKTLRGTKINYAPTVTAKFLAKRTTGLNYYELKEIAHEMCKNGKKVNLDNKFSSNSTHQELTVTTEDAMQPIDKKKPYAALARKVTYYSAITIAACSAIYAFKTLFFGVKNPTTK